MSSFDTLSSLVRAFFALWALSLCLINIISAVLAIGKRRYLFFAFAVALFIPAYFLWQVVFDLSLYNKTGDLSVVSATLVGLAFLWWILAFVVLTAGSILLIGYNIRYEKTFITPNSIKIYLDKIPCGVCCWKDNGRVLFSNICMNELCVALTGGALLNGNQFAEAVADKLLTVGDKKWRFSRREILLGGEKAYEMIASDVTAVYAETQALKKDQAELSRINQELKEYTASIDETVRHQEILQAKVNIHDEMNRLMLSTMAAETEDAETLDKIFSLWEKNALLLCLEAEETEDKTASDRIEELVSALKINLSWQGIATVPEERRGLFYSALQEAIANAAKHAQAKEMVVSEYSTEDGVGYRFVNDGKMPTKEVTFSGGLANLARLAKTQGAELSVEWGEKFVLTLFFKKK